MRVTTLTKAALLLVLTGCTAESAERQAARTSSSADSVTAAVPETDSSAAKAQSSAADSNAEPLAARAPKNDSARLVLRGQSLFQSKGCGRCHTIGEGYMDGPDLQGVTERRSFARITALLTNPEEAIQTDPDFQQLRIEHFLDMPNLNLSTADARALYYYLRAASQNAAKKRIAP